MGLSQQESHVMTPTKSMATAVQVLVNWSQATLASWASVLNLDISRGMISLANRALLTRQLKFAQWTQSQCLHRHLIVVWKEIHRQVDVILIRCVLMKMNSGREVSVGSPHHVEKDKSLFKRRKRLKGWWILDQHVLTGSLSLEKYQKNMLTKIKRSVSSYQLQTCLKLNPLSIFTKEIS